jgi:hypothetical protein
LVIELLSYWVIGLLSYCLPDWLGQAGVLFEFLPGCRLSGGIGLLVAGRSFLSVQRRFFRLQLLKNKAALPDPTLPGGGRRRFFNNMQAGRCSLTTGFMFLDPNL